MGTNYLITGTDTGVGKTTVGCALGFALRARGLRVGVMKPVETGVEQMPMDAVALKSVSSAQHSLEMICPFRYKAPLAPAVAAETEGVPLPDLSRIKTLFSEIAASSDVVLVEGAGGLTVPITWEANYADLARELDLQIVLVVANRLGCINSTLLTLDYAARRALRVKGFILNQAQKDDSPAVATNAATLCRLTAVPYLGSMRYQEPLGLAIVEQFL
ncbi:MAG TPA: dethiobiotin synthase [Candidatus Binataceae bacterium]|nr:dethiobiotin synthase [Candidatus Binataceae bacterium]